jgi:hypothetical protein
MGCSQNIVNSVFQEDGRAVFDFIGDFNDLLDFRVSDTHLSCPGIEVVKTGNAVGSHGDGH